MANAANVAMMLKPLQFRLWGLFDDREERTGDYNPGRFFRFFFTGGSFEIPITSDDLWNRPPKEDYCWISGRLRTSRNSGRIELSNLAFVQSEDMALPSDEAFARGGVFEGISFVHKEVFTSKKTSETGYKILFKSMGLCYSWSPDSVEEFELFPDDEFAMIRGELIADQSYNSEYGTRPLFWRLVPAQCQRLKNRAPSPSGQGADRPQKA